MASIFLHERRASGWEKTLTPIAKKHYEFYLGPLKRDPKMQCTRLSDKTIKRRSGLVGFPDLMPAHGRTRETEGALRVIQIQLPGMGD
jgi:hypothetical protein